MSEISNSISKELKDVLDSRITNAFEFLDLSPTWSLFGEKGMENYRNTNGEYDRSSFSQGGIFWQYILFINGSQLKISLAKLV